ncbi:MAG: flagellar hook-length control protein FliK, partial [Syntrophomonadaceae bacterium]
AQPESMNTTDPGGITAQVVSQTGGTKMPEGAEVTGQPVELAAAVLGLQVLAAARGQTSITTSGEGDQTTEVSPVSNMLTGTAASAEPLQGTANSVESLQPGLSEIDLAPKQGSAAQGTPAAAGNTALSQEQTILPAGNKTGTTQPDGNKGSIQPETSKDTNIDFKASDSISSSQGKETTDVKKIIDLESHRLQNAKLAENSSVDDKPVINTGSNELKNDFVGQLRIDPTRIAEKAAPAEPAAMPDTQEIIDQIVKKTDLMVKLNSSEMKIHLKPEFLGKMLIKVMVDDGIVTARFITESQNVKQVLEANLNSLRQSLESSGMRVDKTEVSVQLYNDGNYSNSGSGQQSMWNQNDSYGSQSFRNQAYREESGWMPADDSLNEAALPDQPLSWTKNDGSVDFII